MKNWMKLSAVFLAVLVCYSGEARAVPAGLTYQGRLVKNNLPVESPAVTLTVKVTSIGVNECVLYEETHSLNMTSSDGIFSVKVGSGTRTVNDKALSVIQVFSNTGTIITGLVCGGGVTTYTSMLSDSRNVYATFNDGVDTVAFSSPYVIQSVPYALEAERLAGKSASEFLQTTADTTQSKVNAIMATTPYTELLALIGGTSSQYMAPGSAISTSGNITQSGTGSFTTGSGAVSLNGPTALSSTFAQTFTGTGTASSLTANSVSTAAAQSIAANGLTSGNILSLTSNSTAAANGNKGLDISISGANGAAGVTRTGLSSVVTSTGATSTNVGGYFSASGATNNYGLIVANGNVGIGTANPNEKLAVGGNLNLLSDGTASADNSSFNFRVSADTVNTLTSALYIYPRDTGTHRIFFGTPTRQVYSLNLFNVTTIENMPGHTGADQMGYSTDWSSSIRRSSENVQMLSSSPTGGNYQWFTNNTYSSFAASPERMRLTVDGKLGIGTLAPSSQLSVTPIQYNTGTASQSLTTVTGAGTAWTSAMIGSQFVFANGVSSGTITAVGSATSLTVTTSQTVASQAYAIGYTGLQVGSTGNVGIGTTSPDGQLQVTSATAATKSLVLRSAASPSVDQFQIQNSAGTRTFSIFSNTAANYSDIGTSTETIRFFAGGITLYGNLGTTNPASFGAYNSSVVPVSITGASGQAANLFQITANGGSSGDRLVVNSAGNVGVGTTNPQSSLQVNGYIQLALTTGLPAAADCDAAAEYGRMKVDAAAGVARLYICTADGWIFK